MAKKRIHQIAKELDIASADVLFHSKELGFFHPKLQREMLFNSRTPADFKKILDLKKF